MVIEDNNTRSSIHPTEEEKRRLNSSTFDIIVDLKECVLLPGSEVEIDLEEKNKFFHNCYLILSGMVHVFFDKVENDVYSKVENRTQQA